MTDFIPMDIYNKQSRIDSLTMEAYIELDSTAQDQAPFDLANNITINASDVIAEFGIRQLLLTVTLSLLILATVVGNTLILFAIATHKALHAPQKYLIASLAISDLMVGLVVMPLSVVNEVAGTWILGTPLCHFWLFMDILYCTASILNLCVISLDRYWAITNSVKYSSKRTTKRILTYIIAVWLLALIISMSPLVGWLSNSRFYHQICFVSQNVYYTIFSTFGAFFIPATIIMVVYYHIFAQAKKSIRTNLPRKGSPTHLSLELQLQEPKCISLPNSPNPLPKSVTLLSSSPSQKQTLNSAPDLNLNSPTTSVKFFNGDATPSNKPPVDQLKAQFLTINNDPRKGTLANSTKRHSLTPASRTYSFSSQLVEERLRQKCALAAAREKQATRSVSIVTGCFLICWLPFFLAALILPLCDTCFLPPVWKSIFLWLGYSNSVLNPIIYTVFNKDFKEAFTKMLLKHPKRTHAIQGKLTLTKI